MPAPYTRVRSIELFRSDCRFNPRSIVAILKHNGGMPVFVRPTRYRYMPAWAVVQHPSLLSNDLTHFATKLGRLAPKHGGGRLTAIIAEEPIVGECLDVIGRVRVKGGVVTNTWRSVDATIGFVYLNDVDDARNFLTTL